jgi:NlpC/P60 family protein/transglycosylase-like protein with SLT domain
MPTKLALAALGVILLIPVLIAAAIQATVSAVLATSSRPSPTALADILGDYLTLYRQAATICPGLDWTILAAIGKVETDHGRSTLPGVHHGENFAGAGGPMQFLQPTFDTTVARHPLPPGGATPPSRYNPHDAIYAAAHYLCDNGARDGHDLHGAIFAYNHADWYVTKVLDQAHLYAATVGTGTGDCTTIQALTPAAFTAINYACGQRGLPYVWGGDGPRDGGFDCSGLTTAAYAAAGITLPRTADAQYRAGPRVPTEQPLLPGDLVFYGNPHATIHHVGLYLGDSLMIDAPDFGQVVKIEPYRHPGDDYAGATHPAR